MGKIIEFPVERVQPSQPAAADAPGWAPLDAAAAAFGASLALWRACAQAWGGVGRGFGQALDVPAESSGAKHRIRR